MNEILFINEPVLAPFLTRYDLKWYHRDTQEIMTVSRYKVGFMAALHTRRSEFIAGLRDTFPLVVGDPAYALVFGALAVNNGLSPAAAMGFSLFVYAGSAQFIASGLVGQGVNMALIIFTTFIVNVRHVLYSTTLAPHMKHLPQRWLLPLGFWLTDETFAIVVNRYNQPDKSPFKHWYHLGSSAILYLNWNLWTFVGLVAGQTIRAEDLSRYGLAFAMDVTFIGMIIPQLKNRPMVLAALAAGFSAVALYGLPNKLGLIGAVLVGIGVGLLAERFTKSENTTIPVETNVDGIPS